MNTFARFPGTELGYCLSLHYRFHVEPQLYAVFGALDIQTYPDLVYTWDFIVGFREFGVHGRPGFAVCPALGSLEPRLEGSKP